MEAPKDSGFCAFSLLKVRVQADSSLNSFQYLGLRLGFKALVDYWLTSFHYLGLCFFGSAPLEAPDVEDLRRRVLKP